MAGGSGQRFWPASRTARPKQLLPLAAGRPLIAATIERLAGLCDGDHTWIVTNPAQVDALLACLPDFPREQVIVEPEPRDTAPCVALATATIAARDPTATMAVMPADHLISPTEEFERMIRRGQDLAADDATLVTFGVKPTWGAPGFGYIALGEACDDASPAAFHAVRFREKPDAATAQQFVAAGMLWNSGIFVWTCVGVQAAMDRSCPELAAATAAMTGALRTGAPIAPVFATTPRKSIDYAVMEQAPQIAVVRATVSWNDVGGFGALAAIGADDGSGNHALLANDSALLQLQSSGNLVYSEGGRTVCLFGVDDLVVVDTGDVLLVCSKERAAELKQFVDHVRDRGRADLL